MTQRRRPGRRGAPGTARAEPLSLVRLGGGLHGLDVRHHGAELFNLARKPALRDLLGGTPPRPRGRTGRHPRRRSSCWAGPWEACSSASWETDGRAGHDDDDPLLHAFTGLSVLSTGVWDFDVYRFLAGWAWGPVLVGACAVPKWCRRHAALRLGMVQAFPRWANMVAALTVIALGKLSRPAPSISGWRYTFLAARAAPLALWCPEASRSRRVAQGAAAKDRMGSYGELLAIRAAPQRQSRLCWLSPGVVGFGASGFQLRLRVPRWRRPPRARTRRSRSGGR